MKRIIVVYPILLSFFLISEGVRSQEIENIDHYYQMMLDDTTLINAIKDNPDVFCDGSLLFLRKANYDERFDLRFQKNDVHLWQYGEEWDCATMSFYLSKIKNRKYNLSVIIRLEVPAKCTHLAEHQSCKAYKVISYSYILKVRKKAIMVRKGELKSTVQTVTFI